MKNFGSWKIIDHEKKSNEICVRKNLQSQKIFYHRKFCVPNNFVFQKILGSKKVLGTKKCWVSKLFKSQKFWVAKSFWVKIKVWFSNILVPIKKGVKKIQHPKNLVHQKLWALTNYGSRKNFGFKKICINKNFIVQKHFGSKKFGSLKILCPQKFGSQNIGVSKHLGPKKIWIKKFWV